MKKFFLPMVLLLLLCPALLSAKIVYSKGQNVAQFGIGVGGLGGFYGSSNLPVLSAGVDFGIHEFISVGGLIGYTTSTFEYPYFFVNGPASYRWKYTYFTIAGRGSYHLPVEIPKTDLYAGLDLGYNIVSARFDGAALPQGFLAANASGSYVFFGIHAGGRYYFSQNFAAYAELGYGFGILNVGVALKF